MCLSIQIIGNDATVSCCPSGTQIRRVNRTTCPATLIVAWLVNLYIEGLFDIGIVTLLQSSPPENTRNSPLACLLFQV